MGSGGILVLAFFEGSISIDSSGLSRVDGATDS